MKSSRSSAKIVSDTTNDLLRATHVSAVWSTMKPASTAMIVSTYDRVVPSSTDWTSFPMSAGPTRPAPAARAWSATTPASEARCRRASVRA
jgi:hypothetical protein